MIDISALTAINSSLKSSVIQNNFSNFVLAIMFPYYSFFIHYMSDFINDIKQISKFRAELMGLATIWVILFHYQCPLPVLRYIAMVGYGGVDVFIFLSGFGLFFSLAKQQQLNGHGELNISSFYFRRFLRVLPTYALIVLIVQLWKGNYNLLSFILNATGIGFFMQGTALSQYVDLQFYDWYVPTILVLYLFFPLIYKFVEKRPLVTIVIAFVISFSIIAIFNFFEFTNAYFYRLGVSRLSLFILGAVTGWYIHSNPKCKPFSRLFVVVALVTLLLEMYATQAFNMNILWNWCVYWLPFILIVPGLCIALSLALAKAQTTFPKVTNLLGLMGSLSLEMYLIHIGIIGSWKQYFWPGYISNPMLDFVVGFFLFVALTFGLSYLLNMVMSRLLGYLRKITYAPGQ